SYCVVSAFPMRELGCAVRPRRNSVCSGKRPALKTCQWVQTHIEARPSSNTTRPKQTALILALCSSLILKSPTQALTCALAAIVSAQTALQFRSLFSEESTSVGYRVLGAQAPLSIRPLFPYSKVLVSAAGLQSPIIGIEPHSSTVRVGESATFRCQVYSGAQPVRLEWKLANNQPLPGNN
ncbi:hypothetical protein GOODEAATRI_026431, partial [Goodea atripinnis]